MDFRWHFLIYPQSSNYLLLPDLIDSSDIIQHIFDEEFNINHYYHLTRSKSPKDVSYYKYFDQCSFNNLKHQMWNFLNLSWKNQFKIVFGVSKLHPHTIIYIVIPIIPLLWVD